MSGRARENLFGTQKVTRVLKTGDNIFVPDRRVIRHDAGFGPTIREQTNDKLNGQPGAADHRLSG